MNCREAEIAYKGIRPDGVENIVTGGLESIARALGW
jgi:hypothetical protein